MRINTTNTSAITEAIRDRLGDNYLKMLATNTKSIVESLGGDFKAYKD